MRPSAEDAALHHIRRQFRLQRRAALIGLAIAGATSAFVMLIGSCALHCRHSEWLAQNLPLRESVLQNSAAFFLRELQGWRPIDGGTRITGIERLPEPGEIFFGRIQGTPVLLRRLRMDAALEQSPMRLLGFCPRTLGSCTIFTTGGQRVQGAQMSLPAVPQGPEWLERGWWSAPPSSVHPVANTNLVVVVQGGAASGIASFLFLSLLGSVAIAVAAFGFALRTMAFPMRKTVKSILEHFRQISIGDFRSHIPPATVEELQPIVGALNEATDELQFRENRILAIQKNLESVLKVTTTMALLPHPEHIVRVAVKSILANLGLPPGASARVVLLPDMQTASQTYAFAINDQGKVLDAPAGDDQTPPRGDHQLSIPLLRQGKTVGSLMIQAPYSILLHQEQEHFLKSLAASIAVMLENVRQRERIRGMTKLELEMETAAAIQQTLVAAHPEIPDITIATAYRPALRVAGDWYASHYDARNDRAMFCIGDATGHGVAPALVAATVSGAFSAIQSLLEQETRTLEEHVQLTVSHLDQVLACAAKGRICMTCLVFAIEPGTGKCAVMNRGHRQLLRAGERVHALCAHGDALGDSGGRPADLRLLQLDPGDLLIAYSDGLVENRGPDGSQLSGRRFRQAIQEGRTSPRVLVSHVLGLADGIWQDRPLDDDVTLLCVRWR